MHPLEAFVTTWISVDCNSILICLQFDINHLAINIELQYNLMSSTKRFNLCNLF
jgi:hypothetical protein